ncbi:CBS domain-containing protein [Aestuariibacter sp. A3R04]|uniref:CBS domain-containing protein n=1 Tax=Aestuariibacter sp. A3R04 TaxID=2841571 RepID=UPI001C096921|nr:CBS domain-containing protein [Aestuariibacter sp. A3R04]MBU3020583.1 CBS domain-containing protein [Aestuariibacter sp. A3R04]
MHSLPLYKTESIDQLAWPENPARLNLQSPAETIFTDFTIHEPMVIDYNAKAVELEHLMKQSHVKMKIVLDKHKQFAGIVTLSDLTEQRIVQKVAEGQSRDELTAADFMQAKASLQSFDYSQIQRSTVGDIVETLKDNGQQHCLVIDRDAHVIRGIISVSDIARDLRLPLDIQAQPSFAALSSVIAA